MELQRTLGTVSLLGACVLATVAGCGDSDDDGGAAAATSSTTSSTTGSGGGSTTSTTATSSTSTGEGGGGSTTTATSGSGGEGGMGTGGGMGAGGEMGTGGAGGMEEPPFFEVTFDDPAVTYTLAGFGGDEGSSVVTDPTDAGNKVAQIVKSATAELWAGVTISTMPNNSIPALPFATNTIMTVRSWSPDAGIEVRLKVEDAADPTHSCETVTTTTVAGGWETLTFDFSNEAPGTAVLDTSYTFNRVSIFYNFGVTGAMVGSEKTYYMDNLEF
jgi:hypothetical protein